MRAFTRVGLALGATAVALALSTSPASAHQPSIEQGNDVGEVAHWEQSGHRRIFIQDNECDGNAVYFEYEDADGVGGAIRDPSGCSNGGYIRVLGNPVDRFRVCERTTGCTRWVDV